MSYLTRLSARVVGPRSSSPAIFPKGLKNNQPGVIARVEETEEEENLSAMRMPATRPIRRQEEEPEEVAPLRRQEKEEEGEENVAPLRRQDEDEEEEVTPLRRQETAEEEGEENVAPLRRQGQEEEEEVAPLRRQETAEEEEELAPLRRQPMRAIARQEEVPLEENKETTAPPSQSSLEPGAEPVSQELAGEEEPSTLQALHRDISSAFTQTPQQHATQSVASDHESVTSLSQETFAPSHSLVPDSLDGISMANPVFQNTGSDDARPNVTIDHIDVLIQEPTLPTSRSESRHNRDRALRARYLRRL